MSVHLQRLRLSIRTKKQFLSGTNSAVHLCLRIEDDTPHPGLDAGEHLFPLNHPSHDDFQAGKADSYEINLAEGSSGKTVDGVPIPNGIQFQDLAHVARLPLSLRIEGSDQWIFDRYRLGGYLVEFRRKPDAKEQYETVEIGWIELANHDGDVAMSTDSKEGTAEHRIAMNGSFE